MDITQNSAILSVITYLCKCKAGKNKDGYNIIKTN